MKRRNALRSLLSAWAVTGMTVAALICLPALPAAAAAEGSFQRALQVSGTGASGFEHRFGQRRGAHRQFEPSPGNRTYPGPRNGSVENVEEKIKRLETNPPIQQSGNDIRIGHIDDPGIAA